jgi:dTDP-4-amino-4,6-dideoxygalactose transaminase
MSEPHAAIGLAALDRYDEVLSARRERAATLTEQLGQHLEFQPGSAASVWQFVPGLAPTRERRNAILTRARDMNIEMRAYHQPLHLSPTLSHYPRAGSLEVTEYLASRVLSLPMANDISDDELDQICSCVIEAES